HGAEENRIALLRELERLVGQRPAGPVDGGAAHVGRMEPEGVAVLRGDCFEDLHGLRHDLGPDAVAGQDSDARLHVFSSPAWRAYANTPRSEEHTSELQSPDQLVCRLLLEKKNRSARDDTNIKKLE